MTSGVVRKNKIRRNRRVLLMIVSCGLIMIVWIMGLIWFVDEVPTNHTKSPSKTDAIIVLTGGTGRLETGLQLLSEGYAKLLFISGVARGLDVQALLKVVSRNRNDFACCIVVGYRADNTAGNAVETTKWIVENKFNFLPASLINILYPNSGLPEMIGNGRKQNDYGSLSALSCTLWRLGFPYVFCFLAILNSSILG